MKIVYYLADFPKISETFILNEICELEKRGHEIKIFARNNPDNKILHEEFNDLNAEIKYSNNPEYMDLPKIFKPRFTKKSVLDNLKQLKHPKDVAAELYYALEFQKYLEELKEKPGLICTHFSGRHAFSVNIASKHLEVPWILQSHAYGLFRKELQSNSKYLHHQSDKIITISNYNKKFIQKKFEIEVGKIDVVPVSIRPEKFQPEGLEEKNKILSVGRFVEKKGLRYGIAAFAEVKEEFPELEYDIIGKGELMSELKGRAEDLGVREDVNFRGHVSDEELVKSMEESKIFLLPCIVAENGDRDGIPTVLKESMALKTPCISTDVSGIPELIEDDEDGFVCEPKNIKEIASKIQKLIESEDKRSEMGENARNKIISEHSISANIGKIEQSFNKTVKSSKMD